MDYLSLFEFVLTALALTATFLNWFITQKLSSFEKRLDKLESNENSIHQLQIDVAVQKQQLDLIIKLLSDKSEVK